MVLIDQVVSHKLSNLLMDELPCGYFAISPMGEIKFVNAHACLILGYSKEEIYDKKNIFDFFTVSSRVYAETHLFPLLFSQGLVREIRFDFKSKLEGKKSVVLSCNTHKSSEGKVEEIQIAFFELKQRLAFEDELVAAQKRNESLLEMLGKQNERLKNFAYIVSHNLKSHTGNLNALLKMMLLEHQELQENEYVKMLKEAAGALSETITHLNEVVATQANESNFTAIDLHQALAFNFTSLKGLFAESNVEYINNVSPNSYVLGVPAYIDSILFNFITNAIKYRREEPGNNCFVKLSTEENNNQLILNIEDNGLGIDLDRNGEKLFGMYKTFHGNKDARGIGLFITHNQLSAIGAKIEVKSKPHQGTTFRLVFKKPVKH